MVTVYNWVEDTSAPVDDITRLLEHLWEGELKDYGAAPVPTHIFCSLVKLANWLNSGTDWTPDEYVTAWEAGNRDSWQVSGRHLLKRHQVEPTNDGDAD